MANPPSHVPAKCFSSRIDPHCMELFISSLSSFSFIFFCSVSKYLFLCSHLPYVMFFLILPSNRNPDSHDQHIFFAVSAQMAYRISKIGQTISTQPKWVSCTPTTSAQRRAIAFSVVDSTCWNGRNWHHDWTFFSFLCNAGLLPFLLWSTGTSYNMASAKKWYRDCFSPLKRMPDHPQWSMVQSSWPSVAEIQMLVTKIKETFVIYSNIKVQLLEDDMPNGLFREV